MRSLLWGFVSVILVGFFFPLPKNTISTGEKEGIWGKMPSYQKREALQELHFVNYIETADISPDGLQVAMVIGKKTERSETLFVYSLKEGKVWKVANGVIPHCVWVDTETLWFHKVDGEKPSVWEWKRNYSKPKLILDGAFNPFPSPDGKWVVCLPFIEVEDEASLKKAANLIIYERLQRKERKISLGEHWPFYCEWSPDSKKLYAFCFPPLKSPSFAFHILLLKPPSFKSRTVCTNSYPIAQKGSWCLEDGSIVFVTREDWEQYTSPFFKVPAFSEGNSEIPLSTFCFWKYDEREGKAKLIWKEKGYSRSFAISPDGGFLLIPHQGLDPQKRVYSYLNLVDLQSKETRIIEKEEIRQGVGRVWYHQRLKGFCIVTPTKLFFMQGQGEIKQLVSIEGLGEI